MGRRLLTRRHPEVQYLILVRVGIPGVVEKMRDLAITYSLPPSDRRMPHITLFGPFTLAEPGTPQDVLDCIERAAEKIHDAVYSLGELLELRGRKGKAIVCRVRFPENLVKSYQELSTCLFSLAGSCTWLDRQPEKRVVHITLAFNLPASLAREMKEYLLQSGYLTEGGTTAERLCSPDQEEHSLAGIAVLRNGMLWKEYDLAQRSWRERKELYPL
jgi:hypothetical protein